MTGGGREIRREIPGIIYRFEMRRGCQHVRCVCVGCRSLLRALQQPQRTDFPVCQVLDSATVNVESLDGNFLSFRAVTTSYVSNNNGCTRGTESYSQNSHAVLSQKC